jgi:hypothetical protein
MVFSKLNQWWSKSSANVATQKAKSWLTSPMLRGLFITVGLAVSEAAHAQFSTSQLQPLCIIPTIVKFVFGVCALVALLVWAIAHMNNKNELSDMTMKIGVPCVIASVVGYLIQQFGLPAVCQGI